MYKYKNKFSENADSVADRYRANPTESIKDIFDRVATALARVQSERELEYYNFPLDEHADIRKSNIFEERKLKYFNVMYKKQFVPAGRTLANAGHKAVVANCVVLGIEDTMQSIGNTMTDAMLLQQQGCGIGFDFSKLRPAGYKTVTSQGVASGPISFMSVYNNTFGVIKQQGRHGANMGMLNIHHPDIIDFITCKDKEGSIVNFNISVLVTDEFMENLKDNPDKQAMATWDGKQIKYRKPVRKDTPFGEEKIMEPLDITYKELWDILCTQAHKNGEPGVAFVDTINKNNPLPGLGDITTTNPCGEIPLHVNDNCNIGSINVLSILNDDFTINWERLDDITNTAVEMLDNTVDLFQHSVEKINETARANRRIGLGIMGWADLLQALRISYDSEEAYDLAEKLMKRIYHTTKAKSAQRARFGVYSNIDKSANPNIKRRNAALMAIAPTGSISMLLDVNSGIEPYFSLAYYKTTRGGKYLYVAPIFEDYLDEQFDGETKREILNLIIENGYTFRQVNKELDLNISDKYLDVFTTTMELPPDAHIDCQAAFQKHVDNSISKTINMPNDATVEDVAYAFMMGYLEKLKSVTVYRDGSRKFQVLNVKEKKPVVKQKSLARPKTVFGFTEKIGTGHGDMYVVVNYWDDEPKEVFASLGKEGGDTYAFTSAITRIVSIALRYGVPIDSIIKQLKGITSTPHWEDGVRNESPVDALSQVLSRAKGRSILGVASSQGKQEESTSVADICPNCYNSGGLVMQEGCITCRLCGYSRC